MGFIIEAVVSKVLEKFLHRTTGWDIKKYEELIHNSQTFMFRRYDFLYVFLRFFNFFLLLVSTIGFLFIFFWGIFHNHDYVIAQENDRIVFVQYNEEYIYASWSFLLYGMFFYLDMVEYYKFMFPKNATLNLKRNLWTSCFLTYWIVLAVSCSLRLILLFTMEKAYLVMNPYYVSLLLQDHPTSVTLQYGLFVSYYCITIFNGLIVLICLYVIFFHPRLKEEALAQCAKSSSKLMHYLGINPEKVFTPIKSYWANLSEHMQNFKKEHNSSK